MRLDALASSAPQARAPAVPAWTLGCFHRRCITFANGTEDTTTQVVWIQSHGQTGDIRIPAGRPDLKGRGGFEACTPDELVTLAAVEGGVADTGWSEPLMRWDNWAAFQPYDRWPEPGELRRVGGCLIEWAPSGAYVEDWRLQPGSSGLRVGLRLVSEDGRPRDGGLVVAGDHAILSLGRRTPLPSARPASDQLRDAADPYALAATVFEAETTYATRAADGAGFVARLSTNPFREGQLLPLLDGFDLGAEPDLLVQRRLGAERVWRIDTLHDGTTVAPTTPTTAAGEDWLAHETAVVPIAR